MKELWHFLACKTGEGNDKDGYFSIILGTVIIEKAWKYEDEEKLAIARKEFPDVEYLANKKIEWV